MESLARILLLIGLTWAQGARSLTTLEAYDCDHPMGVRTYSAREVEVCENHDIRVDTLRRSGQVLKKITGKPIEVYRCHVTVDIAMANCGAYGHWEGIFPDFARENEKITSSECAERTCF